MVVSVAEQIICAYAQTYLGTFPSSWDELVVYIRSWLQQPDSQELVRTFESRIAHMIALDIARAGQKIDRTASVLETEASITRSQDSETSIEDYT